MSQEHDNDLDGDLDGALRRMLADLDGDDRLTVAVRPGAAEAIVAGARRARRRRITALAATGALTAAAVVVGGMLAVGGPHALPPATSRHQVAPDPSAQSSARVTTSPRPAKTRQSTSAETKPAGEAGPGGGVPNGGGGGGGGTIVPKPPPPPAGELIGPASWRALSLGLSYDDAMATGLLAPADPPPASGCEYYPIVLGGQQHGWVRISAASGTEVIYPAVRLHTPEGATNGWTLAQVKAVYPDVDEAEVANTGNGYAAVPGNPGAVYRFEITDQLVGIALQASAAPCGG